MMLTAGFAMRASGLPIAPARNTWPAMRFCHSLKCFVCLYSFYVCCPGDDEDRWFSFDPAVHVPREQMCCYLTHTTADTHKLIQDNLKETPVYGGWVDAKGPRYCPSIEDKIVRFADKKSHQVSGKGCADAVCALRVCLWITCGKRIGTGATF